MAQKVIITDYPDGSRVMSNIRNKKGVPVFKENDTYTATRVTTWYDGTPMDDSKADGKVYLKHTSSGEYYLVNLPNWGETFLQKPNADALRNMSSTEILLIRIGYYKGAELLGYYAEEGGDTPAPIDYRISDTAEEDDGGSVFEVGGIKLKHEFSKRVNVLYFGAKGDNNEDDTIFIQKSADYCSTLANKPILIFPEGFFFKTTDTIIIEDNIHVDMGCPVSYQGPMDRRAIIIGNSSRSYQCKYQINVTATNARSDWSNEHYIGVEFINLYSSEVIMRQASFFTEGVRFSGIDGSGFVYNHVIINDLGHNKFQGHLWSNNGGWVNQNCFYGGRLQRASHINRGKSCYGFKLSSEDGYRQNTNRFYNVSIELNDEASRDVVRDSTTNEIISVNSPDEESVPILIERGRHNKFEIRDEGNTYTIKTLNDSHNNEVQALFSSVYARYDTRVKDLGLHPSTKFKTNIQVINQELGHCVLNIPNLSDYVSRFNSSTYNVISPLRIQNSDTSNPTMGTTGISVADHIVNVTVNSGIGFRLDTRIRKRFNIGISYINLTTIGRLYIVCRDIDGNIIPPNTQTAAEFVKSSGRYNTFLSNRFGAGVTIDTGISGDRDPGNIMQFFCVPEESKFTDVYFSGYQNTAELTGFSVFSLDGTCAVIPYINQVEKLVNQMPTEETYSGDFRFSITNNQIGWAYKLGSWREIGGVASTTVKGEVLRVPNSPDTATQAAGETPTKAEFDALLAELRDLKTKMRAGDAPILSS